MSNDAMAKKNSKHFCILPWLHFHAWPDGRVFPCCLAGSEKVFGNLSRESVSEIINSREFRELRLRMLNDQPSQVCRSCYELEADANSYTLRKSSLQSFSNRLSSVDEMTNSDGSIKSFDMAYLDIRFSNICNFKCRTCGPDFSSSWQEEFRSKGESVGQIPIQIDGGFEKIKPYLDRVEEVYFAGGEPLVSPEHYEILDYWIKSGRTDVRLRYTTNFSHFKFKSYDLIELWKNFRDVRVAASLDDEGIRGEYIRKGTKWETIVRNRKEMMALCPDIHFEITPTVSIFNVLTVPEFHRNWIEAGLLRPENIRINYLLNPEIYSAKILGANLRNKMQDIYGAHAEFLAKQHYADERAKQSTIDAFKGVQKFVLAEDRSHLIPDFLTKNQSVDSTRSESLFETFPHLRGLREND